jgi:ferredoxin
LDFFKVFGKVQNSGKKMLRLNTKEVEVSAIGNYIRIKFKDEEKQHNILRLVEMALNCVGCGACQAFCEYGAIKVVEGKRIIDEQRCVKCLKCLNSPCIALKYGFKRLTLNA